MTRQAGDAALLERVSAAQFAATVDLSGSERPPPEHSALSLVRTNLWSRSAKGEWVSCTWPTSNLQSAAVAKNYQAGMDTRQVIARFEAERQAQKLWTTRTSPGYLTLGPSGPPLPRYGTGARHTYYRLLLSRNYRFERLDCSPSLSFRAARASEGIIHATQAVEYFGHRTRRPSHT